jgi:tetratricopeptide (TPR) repeat protein
MVSLLAVTFLLAAASKPATVSKPAIVQAERLVKEGDKLLGSERYEQALQAYREAIGLDPTMMMAHYGAGQAQMAMKQYREAITSFRDARDAFHARAALGQDRRFQNERARQDRIQLLRDRIRQNQERVVPPGSVAERARDRAILDYDNQIQLLQRTDETIGSPPPALPPGLSLALGSAYFRSGKLEDAEREYRAAIESQPKLGEPRNNLAVVLFLTGRATEAHEQIKAAEQNGFPVASGLKKDIESALSAPPAKP